MKVQVEDVTAVEKRLSIEVDAGFVEKELSQAYAALAGKVKVPGFRPGKIPRRILERHYKAEVEADVLRRVQLLGFYDAIEAHKLSAVSEPHFSGGALEAAKPYAYVARFEVKPTITPKDYRGLPLDRLDPAITDEKVAEQLERLRSSRTTLSPVSDRDTVQRDDVVKVDFEGTIDGKPFPGNTGKDAGFEVTDGRFTEGRWPALEGTKVGAAVELDAAFPADFPNDEVKGKTAHFVVTPKLIQKKDVPALDDTFATSLGLSTLEELKGRIRADLERARRREVENQEREDIFKKLAEKNSFEVPRAMVERGANLLLDAALGTMVRSGMDPRSLDLDWAKLRSELFPRAEGEVRGQLLLEAIGDAEGITATDEDLEQKMVVLAEETGVPAATVRKRYAQEEARENLRARVRDDKVINFLKSNAKYENAGQP